MRCLGDLIRHILKGSTQVLRTDAISPIRLFFLHISFYFQPTNYVLIHIHQILPEVARDATWGGGLNTGPFFPQNKFHDLVWHSSYSVCHMRTVSWLTPSGWVSGKVQTSIKVLLLLVLLLLLKYYLNLLQGRTKSSVFIFIEHNCLFDWFFYCHSIRLHFLWFQGASTVFVRQDSLIQRPKQRSNHLFYPKTCQRTKARNHKRRGDAHCSQKEYDAALEQYDKALWIVLKALGEVQGFDSESRSIVLFFRFWPLVCKRQTPVAFWLTGEQNPAAG